MIVNWGSNKEWDDEKCGNKYPFLCGLPFCKREQEI
jgi:hypothetical protein